MNLLKEIKPNIWESDKIKMNKKSRGILFLILMLSLHLTVICKTYYVDYSNSQNTSSDMNDGTSETSAFVHCPGDSRFTGSVSLDSGDTIYFKKGVTYKGMIRTITSDIIYTVTNWGKGDAVIDGTGQNACFRVHHSSIEINGQSDKNLVLTGLVQHAAIWSYGSGNLSNSKFSNLKIKNVGSRSSVEGIGIKIGGDNNPYKNYKISDCHFSECYSYAIKISGSGTRDIEIFNNLIEHNGYIGNGISQVNISSNAGTGVQGVLFHNNVVRRSAPNANGLNCNNVNNEIYDNEIYENSGSAISLSPGYNSNVAGEVKVYRNKIYNNGKYGIIIGGARNERHALIYNNIFANNTVAEINFVSGSSSNKIIYNTIYNSNRVFGIRVQSNCNYIVIQNNLIKTGSYAIYDNTGTIQENNNGIYQGNRDVLIWKGSFFNDLETYKSTTRQGENTIWTKTMFSDTSEFTLDMNSKCIGAALPVREIIDDYNGNSRGSNPDMGAIQNFSTGVKNPKKDKNKKTAPVQDTETKLSIPRGLKILES